MVEALICLPIFVAALTAVVALDGIYGAKLEAKARARRVAWLQADSGQCPEQSCQTHECGRIATGIRENGFDEALAVHDERFSLRSFLGNVRDYFLGKTTNGVGIAQASIPKAVSSGRSYQRGVTTLLCNTTTRHAETGGSVLDHACLTGLGTTEYANEV